MLVLSRKRDEQIILRHPGIADIKITVVRIDGRNKVRLGIEADRAVTILRSELLVEDNSEKGKSTYSKAL